MGSFFFAGLKQTYRVSTRMMGIATTGIAGILMIVMIPILILISWIMWKAGIVKVVPND